jgi:hypothetical protein
MCSKNPGTLAETCQEDLAVLPLNPLQFHQNVKRTNAVVLLGPNGAVQQIT